MNRNVKIRVFPIALFLAIVLIANANASIITVDDDLIDCPYANYTSIQPAINNATDGDIILVYNGTYNENEVVVNKTLNLTGTGMPVIDGMNKGNTVKIESNNCTISSFRIINSAGDWNLAGIHIASSHNIISNNIISSNRGHGIGIYSGNNEIYSNTLSSNGWAGVGIYAGSNKIYSNDIHNNGYGFRLFESGSNTIYSNNIRNNGYGFYCYASRDNTIYSNIIFLNSNDAFYMWNSRRNKIFSNEISGSDKGFEIWIHSNENAIFKNNVTNNNKGIYIYYPSYPSKINLFYHNNFIENSENNTWDECTNNWYNETLEEGNYYDDYEGTDADEDGIGDMPYNISAGDNQDLYPLMEVYAEEENKPPVAYFTYSPLNPVVGETITFNASSSYDQDGNITAYEWEFGDGANGTGEIVEHSYSAAGNYTVNLTVTDDDGAKNSSFKIVNVSAIPNKPPVAYFTYSPGNPVVNETIIFNASLSFDPDGNITAYEWEFGDEANGTGEIVNHSYSAVGNYTVNLTVTDDDGAENSTSKTIRVVEVEKEIFDTGSPENPYPSIFGMHNGTIKPYKDIYVERMFTYPCAGTGGHSEFVRIWGNGLDVNATWGGYGGDWHNIAFDEAFVLKANVSYNYTIRTGSYPQIHHTDRLEIDNGVITCQEFIDVNGKRYDNWIPAIRLE